MFFDEQMKESLDFLSESLIRSFFAKNEQFAQKTIEQIPNPANFYCYLKKTHKKNIFGACVRGDCLLWISEKLKMKRNSKKCIFPWSGQKPICPFFQLKIFFLLIFLEVKKPKEFANFQIEKFVFKVQYLWFFEDDNSHIFRNWTHKNIFDRQHSARFQKLPLY